MQRFISYLFLIFIPGFLTAQERLRNDYPANLYNAHPLMWDAVEDNLGRIWFANNEGIVRFDGNNFTTFPVPHPVRSLTFGPGQTLYLACLGDFGRVEFHADGSFEFVSLLLHADHPEKFTGNDMKVIRHKGEIYFIGRDILAKVIGSGKNLRLQVTSLPNNLGCFSDDEHLYINLARHGLCIFNNSSFKPVENGDLLAGKQISNAIIGKTESIIASAYDGLFKFKNGTISPFPSPASTFALAGVTGICSAGKDGIAVATFHNGVRIFNSEGTQEMFPEFPSLETYSIFRDHENNLWIGHLKGLSQLLINIDVFALNTFHVKGFVTDIKVMNGMVYVSTTSGLYSFPKNEPERLEAAGGVNDECWDMLLDNGHLYIASTNGLFDFVPDKVTTLVPNETFVHVQKGFEGRLYAFGESGCTQLIKKGDTYTNSGTITRGMQNSMNMGPDGNYLAGTDYDGLRVKGPDAASFPAELKSGKARVITKNGEILILAASGVFSKKGSSIARDETLSTLFRGCESKRFEYENDFWIMGNSFVRQVKNNEEVMATPAYLLNGKPSALCEDGNQTWIAFGDKIFLAGSELPALTPLITTMSNFYFGQNKTAFSGFFMNNSSEEDSVQTIVPEIPFEESNIRIEMGINSFFQPGQNRFRYMIKGLSDHWSSWSGQSKVELAGLNGGSYTFIFQARDALGRIAPEN